MKIEARLFGIPSVRVDGREVTLPYKKAEALLYYLILRRSASRSDLAGLLWEDDPSSALKNLRHAVYSIRKAFSGDPFDEGRRSVLQFAQDTEISCDVTDFMEHPDPQLYGGDFLGDFSVQHADAFDEWLTDQRSMLSSLYLHRLLSAEEDAFSRGDYPTAEQYALRYIAEDPLEERAVFVLMQTYRAQSKYRKAIGLYHTLTQGLAKEYSVSPMKETSALYYQIVDEWNELSAVGGRQENGSKLIGKDEALRKLVRLCNSPRTSEARVCLLVQGETGVGKSYLIDHLLEQYDFSDRLVCRVSCYQSEIRTAFAPWNAVMLELASKAEPFHPYTSAPLQDTVIGLFPNLSPDQRPMEIDTLEDFLPDLNYNRTQEGTVLLLRDIAEQIPLLIVMEDIHWMDPYSAELLTLLLRRLRNADVTVVLTSRTILPDYLKSQLESAQHDKLMESCMIGDFTREECVSFIEDYSPGTYDADTLEKLYQNTGGNALLLVQLLSAIKERGTLSTIPDGSSEILRYRLSGLTADERRVLEAVSAFNLWAPVDILAAILTMDPLDLMCLCDLLKRRMLLTEIIRSGQLGYSLLHEKIRDILNEQQPESGRRILHLRIAQYLESSTETADLRVYEQLVQHYAAGGNHYKTLKYRILSLSVFTELCYELMPILTDQSEPLSFDEEGILGYFEMLKKDLAHLRATSFGAHREEFDQLERILLYAASRYDVHNGYYERALQTLAKLLSACRAADDMQMESKAHLQYIYYAVQTNDFDVMDQHLHLGMQLKDVIGKSADWGSYLRLRGLYYLKRGDYEQARSWLMQSVQFFERLNSESGGQYVINIAGAYNYIAETYRLEKDFNKAFSYYDKAIIYNRSSVYYPGAAVFYTDYGVAAYQSGRKEEAYHLFLYAEELYLSFHEYSKFPITLSYLALYDSEAGQWSSAAQRLRKALDISEQIGSPLWMGFTLYISWKIRALLERSGENEPELSHFWPASKEEHCLWALEYLRRIEPCPETDEMEDALRSLNAAAT